MFQMKNKIKPQENKVTWIGNLTEKQSRVMIIKTIKEIGRRPDAQSKKL